MLIYHFFLFKMQIRSDCNALKLQDINVNLSFLSLGSKMWNEPPCDPRWVSFEILLLHILFNDAWQFAIKSAESHLKMLIYHLLKMQISVGTLGNPINVNLSFLSLGSKVVEWNPLTQHENFWNSTFACTVQWCMIICHKWFFHQLLKIQIWNPIKDINVNLSFLSLESKVVEWTHRTYKIWNLEQLKYVTDVEPLYRSME